MSAQDGRLTQSTAQVQADLNKIEATPEFTSVGSGVIITSKVLGLDTSVAALKTDLTAGEIDVTFNGTATNTTQMLDNVVVGATTYVNQNLYVHKDVMLKTTSSTSTNRLKFVCAIPATGLTTGSSDVAVSVSDVIDWNPVEVYFYSASGNELYPCRCYKNSTSDYGFVYLNTSSTPAFTKIACTSVSTILYDNTSVSGKSSVTLLPSARVV